MITIAVTKQHDQRQLLGSKGLFGLHVHITVHHLRESGQEFKQGRSPEAGADAETVEKCYFLALFPHPVFF